MLELIGRSNSINVRKVLWLLQELGLSYQHHEHYNALESLNPNRLVPVLRDGTFVLWESNAICRYLASRYARHDLLPLAPGERAVVEQWMDWQAGELNNSWRYAFMGLVRQSPAHQDPKAIAASIDNWNRHMGMLEKQLAHAGPFVLGKQFSLADIVLGLSTHRWFFAPITRPELPHLAAYYDLLAQRPGYQRHGRNNIP